MFRKRLAFILSLVMVLSSVPITPAFATENSEYVEEMKQDNALQSSEEEKITREEQPSTEASTEEKTTKEVKKEEREEKKEASTEASEKASTEASEKASTESSEKASTESSEKASTEASEKVITENIEKESIGLADEPSTEAPVAPTTESSRPTEATEFYYMDYVFPNNTNSVLLNTKVTISTKLHHQYTDDDGRGHNEEVTGYTIALDNGKRDYREICTLEGDNNNIRLEMLQKGEYSIPLKAIISESENKTIEVSSLNMDVNAVDSYYFIETPDFDPDWPISRTAQFDLKVKQVTTENSDPQDAKGEIYFNIQQEDGCYDDLRFNCGSGEQMNDNTWASSDLEISLTRDTANRKRITIIAATKEGEEYTAICRKDLVFNDVSKDLSFTGLNDGPDCRVYEDGSITVTPNIDLFDYTNPEKNDIKYRWNFKVFAANAETGNMEYQKDITLNSPVQSDGSITLNGAELKGHITKDQYIEACLQIRRDSATIAENSFKVRIQETEVNYGFPWDENVIVLKEMEFNIDDFSAYIRSSEYPDGEDIPCFIQDVQSSDENVCTFTKDANLAPWKATFHDIGQATITVKFRRHDMVEDQTTFTINVVDKMLSVYFDYPNDCQSILKGQSIDINTSVRAEWKSEEDGYCCDDVEDYALEILEYDSDLIQAQVAEDGHTLHVTSKGDGGYANIKLKATCEVQIGSETHELERVVKTGVDVRADYYYMYSDFDTNMMIGKPSETTFGARHVYLDENRNKMEEEITDALSYNIQYSEDNFAVAEKKNGSESKGDNTYFNGSTEDLVLYLTRKNKESCDFRISASLETGEEICNRTFFTNYLDNQIEFDGLRDGDHTWIFDDEKMAITAVAPVVGEYVPDNQNDPKPEWEWKLFSYWHGQDDSSREEIKEGYSVEDNKITIVGSEIPSINPDDQYYRVELTISYKDSRNTYILAENSFGLEIREPVYNTFQHNDYKIIPDRSDYIERYFQLYFENSEYPHGETVDCEVTSVQIENEDICSLSKQNDGWEILGKICGETNVTITYKVGAETKEYTSSYKLTVDKDVLYPSIHDEEDTYQMLPNKEKVIEISVDHEWNYEDSKEPGYETLDDFTLTLEGEDGQPAFDSNVLTAEVATDGKSIIVKSNGNDNTESLIYYKVSYTVNKGTDKEYTVEKIDFFTINVNSSYYRMTDCSLDPYLKVGKSATISPKLYLKSAESDQEYTSYKIKVEYDSNDFEVKDSHGNVIKSGSSLSKENASFTVKRLSNRYICINFIGEVYDDSNKIYSECCRKELSLPGKDYAIWAENVAGDANSDVIIKDCDLLTVKLNSDLFNDYSTKDITWTYELSRVDNNVKIPAGYKAGSNGSVTFDGVVLKKYLASSKDKRISAHAYAKIGKCIVAEGWVIIRLQEHKHSYSKSYTIDVQPTLSRLGSKSRHCTARGCSFKTNVTSIPKIVAPKAASFTKASNTKGRKVTLKWKKVKGIAGYQVRYVLGTNKKIVTLKASATSKVISKLKKNKTYKFSIRTYKTVNGVNYYSKWSKDKKVKIKK